MKYYLKFDEIKTLFIDEGQQKINKLREGV
jgi:hypothetical protein